MLFTKNGTRKLRSFTIATLSVMFASAFFLASGGTAAASTNANPIVTSSSLGEFAPIFAGPAATGCDVYGCSLLTGPFFSPSTAPLAAGEQPGVANPRAGSSILTLPRVMPEPGARRYARLPYNKAAAAAVTPPSVSCEPLGPGCDSISFSAGNAVGVKGLNAVDSASQSTNVLGVDIEPADQGLCAGNGYVVEANNLGEILVFNTALQRASAVIPLDTLMGLTSRGWSSGGDISCVYDHDNGGHWIFTEIVSASPETSGGAFGGCFAGVPNSCYEGIAVTTGSDPYGPYSVYFLNANYNPGEPGYPYLFNDFAKIATTRDAFLLFYDEFPDNGSIPGFGGGFFNGAQQFAIDKNALELGLPVFGDHGKPNPAFNVAIENMGLLPTPNGTCFSDNQYHLPGITCWYAAIPAHAPDPTQYDNSHGGSGFILDTLDFYGLGDDRVAVFDWTGLKSLNSPNCSACSHIQFGGQLFSGVSFYYGEGFLAEQKNGPIPLGDECGAAGLSVGSPPPASCPESGIATNGDFMTQVSQAQGQIWGATTTAIAQTYSSESAPEVHQGAVYWVIGTDTFDTSGFFTLTGQGYVSPKHGELEFPSMAAEGLSFQDGGNGGAIMTFTLSSDGVSKAVYPSTAYGRLTSTSNGLLKSIVNIVDLGQSPQDGFTEYQGYPGPTRARWGDYSNAVYLWGSGKIYFATNYIQYANCTGSEFTLTLGTCDGTRDGYANWGTSVNYVVP
ncbi:MAG: hypothetical protein WCC99_15275 [Candidatus Sulfotelmatobacter sp.]